MAGIETPMQAPIRQLWALYLQLDRLEGELALLDQSKRRERGAYVHPHASEATTQLETRLLKSFHELFITIIASLKGSSDDIISGRLFQRKHRSPESGEQREASEYFDVDEEAPVDRNRLEAILALLALWKGRHSALLEDSLQGAFSRGRDRALKEVALDPKQFPMADLSPSFTNRYQTDVATLADHLENGSRRSEGLRWIIANAPSLGAVALYLRRLENQEKFRVEMMAEHGIWWAGMDGYREGATTANRYFLNLGQEPPRYQWAGPLDARTCSACAGTFGEPVSPPLASPDSICEGSQNCRHGWELVA